MSETPEDLLKKIPKVYVKNVDTSNKVLTLNDEETTGYMWDTKFRYWVFNLQEQGYKVEYK